MHFNPAPPLTAAAIDDLCDPSLSINEIASDLTVSIDALACWITRPDIQEKLANLATAAALRSRLLAALQLPSAVDVISSILKGYTAAENSTTGRDTPEATALRESRRTNARRAASLLLRIARYHFELTPRTSSPHSPPGRAAAPRGSEGSISSPSTSPLPLLAPISSTISAPAHSEPPARVSSSPPPEPPDPKPLPEPLPAPTQAQRNLSTIAPPAHPTTRANAPAPSSLPHPTSDIPHPTSHIRYPTSDIPHPPSNPASPTLTARRPRDAPYARPR